MGRELRDSVKKQFIIRVCGLRRQADVGRFAYFANVQRGAFGLRVKTLSDGPSFSGCRLLVPAETLADNRMAGVD